MSSRTVSVGSLKSNTPREPPPPSSGDMFALRPFDRSSDPSHVQYLFYSTYFNLVPRGVKLRAQSPQLLGLWLVIFAVQMALIPDFLAELRWPRVILIGVRVVLVVANIAFALGGLFWYVDKFDVTERVEEGLDNDLLDPDAFYRCDTKGNFWVLTLNGKAAGCIGIDFHTNAIPDQRPFMKRQPLRSLADSDAIRNAQWPRLAHQLARIDDTMRWMAVTVNDAIRTMLPRRSLAAPKILFEARGPNEATIRRLAVRSELQGKGLATPLVKRAVYWAHEHQIETVYAETDELQIRAADILTKKFGFTLVSSTKLGHFRTKTTWKLDVNQWMSKEMEERASSTKAKQGSA